jgi:hypothetical protein
MHTRAFENVLGADAGPAYSWTGHHRSAGRRAAGGPTVRPGQGGAFRMLKTRDEFAGNTVPVTGAADGIG